MLFICNWSLLTKMISFHFLAHLIALASLFRIAIPYTVNSDCGDRGRDVNNWVVEAHFLYGRAAKVLGSTLTPNIRNILQACLGESAKDADFEAIRGWLPCT
jgi:hypothetical protein